MTCASTSGLSLGLDLALVRIAVPVLLHRQDELEACAVGLRVLVDEIAVVRTGVRARNREAEPGAADSLAAASGETLEELRNELRRHTVAVILDEDAKVAVVLNGVDIDRGHAVPQSVRDEVADDPVERAWIGGRLEIGVDPDLDIVAALGCDRSDNLLDPVAQVDALGRDRDRVGVRRGRSSNCSTSFAMRSAWRSRVSRSSPAAGDRRDRRRGG
mgnify:CR=1 FL=1